MKSLVKLFRRVFVIETSRFWPQHSCSAPRALSNVIPRLAKTKHHCCHLPPQISLIVKRFQTSNADAASYSTLLNRVKTHLWIYFSTILSFMRLPCTSMVYLGAIARGPCRTWVMLNWTYVKKLSSCTKHRYKAFSIIWVVEKRAAHLNKNNLWKRPITVFWGS